MSSEQTERETEIGRADAVPQKWRIIWMMEQRSRAAEKENERNERTREKRNRDRAVDQ